MDQATTEQGQFVYYISEGAVMRQVAPGSGSDQVWVWGHKTKQWKPYHDMWDFIHTAVEIPESQAQEIITRQ